MTMKGEDGGVCWSCTVTVDYEGVATAVYQWEGNPTQGSDRFDECMSDWSDDDIREHAALMIGITEGRDAIEVVWD